MPGLSLTREALEALRETHHRVKHKRAADRIKAVYGLAMGHSIAQVASLLMISEETGTRLTGLLRVLV